MLHVILILIIIGLHNVHSFQTNQWLYECDSKYRCLKHQPYNGTKSTNLYSLPECKYLCNISNDPLGKFLLPLPRKIDVTPEIVTVNVNNILMKIGANEGNPTLKIQLLSD